MCKLQHQPILPSRYRGCNHRLACFAECVACDVEVPEYAVTFNVNMSNETVAETGVYLAGGGNFGNPGDNEMTDPDGDGIYSITMMLDEGFSSYYTFTNGAWGIGPARKTSPVFLVVILQTTMTVSCRALLKPPPSRRASDNAARMALVTLHQPWSTFSLPLI